MSDTHIKTTTEHIAYDPLHFYNLWGTFQKDIDPLLKGTSFETKNALESSENLLQEGEFRKYRLFAGIETKVPTKKDIYSHLNKEPLKPFLAMKLTEILASSAIQFDQPLKRVLSKVCSLCWEIIAFERFVTKDHFYEEDIKKSLNHFRKVLGTLPKKDVETKFFLKRSKGALKTLQFGKGKKREAISQEGAKLMKGIFETVLSTSGAPPFVNLSSLVSPLADLSTRFYHQAQERWYRDIWTLNWYSAGNRLIKETQLRGIETILKKGDPKLLAKRLSNYRIALYISQLFMEIIKNPKAEETLKIRVFRGEAPSLLSLAQIQHPFALKFKNKLISTTDYGNFWEVRYITVESLKEILQEKPSWCSLPLQKEITDLLTKRYYGKEEPNKHVYSRLEKIFSMLYKLQGTHKKLPENIDEIILEKEKSVQFLSKKLKIFSQTKRQTRTEESTHEKPSSIEKNKYLSKKKKYLAMKTALLNEAEGLKAHQKNE